tara:strand:+ start:154 stop:1377 length:1224 start_codon:yes stop_codon:yes gene_type:complete
MYDVVFIGAGPASCAAATLLSQQGHSCLMVERSKFPRYHVGESLIPQTYGTLKRLGLLKKMKKSHFPVKESVRFVNESGKGSQPFYFSETINSEKACTWQVERSEFDELCLENAEEKGVEVMRRTRVEKVLFDKNKKATGLAVVGPDKKNRRIKAKVVVDGSGRSTVIGRQLKLKGPVPGLKKASMWAYYKGGTRFKGRDAGETTILMIPGGGWFWYIPLPEDMFSVGVVADPKYLFDGDEKSFESVFLREVDKCKTLKKLLKKATRETPVRGYRTLSYWNREVSGDGWLMVGDAAAFLDPVYSSGLFLALASGELAASSIHEALVSGDLSGEKIGAHVPALKEGVEVVRRVIYAFYDPDFSFQKFLMTYPQHRKKLIDCLIGDVVGKNMKSFLRDLDSMSPSPAPM